MHGNIIRKTIFSVVNASIFKGETVTLCNGSTNFVFSCIGRLDCLYVKHENTIYGQFVDLVFLCIAAYVGPAKGCPYLYHKKYTHKKNYTQKLPTLLQNSPILTNILAHFDKDILIWRTIDFDGS